MSFNTEKNVPEVKFIADSTKRATGLYGPEALSEDITEIVKMFDPESTHSDNITPGGISKENLSNVLNASFICSNVNLCVIISSLWNVPLLIRAIVR